MNNEPVAWMFQGAFDTSTYVSFEKPNPEIYPNLIPLYTHPVSKAKDRFPNYESICLQCGTTIYKPFKELTDEEIALTWNEFSALQSPKDIKDFARAILRKAQEK